MENWKFALSSILGHKLRSFLTMLGIIIGVASVVVIMAMGEGMKASVTKSLAQSQQDVSIYFEATSDSGDGAFGLAFQDTAVQEDTYVPTPVLNENWMKEVVATIDGIDNYYLTNATSATVAYKNRKADSVNITGINETYFDVKKYKILAGRSFNKVDYRQFARIIMLDTQLAVKLFGSNQEALNKIVSVGEKSYLVVGIYEDPNTGTGLYGMKSEGNAVMANSQLAAEYGVEEAQSIFIHVEDALRASELGQEAAAKMTQLAGVTQGRYTIFDLSRMLADINKEVGVMTTVIGSIAGISLLVGGIGVMNIMLVSVTERTREIGLRKALGATRGNILTQFLIEAMVLTMLGGLIGLGIAFAIVMLIGNGMAAILGDGAVMTVSLPVAIGSVIFSGFIGVLFGLLPANKASKLDPIEALRYE